VVRQQSALALGKIGPAASSAVPGLIRTLKDPEWAVRRQAAVALGEIGPGGAEAMPQLELLRRDESSVVRKAAEEALLRVRGEVAR